MKIVGETARKWKQIRDVFEGTCEINNYNYVKPELFGKDKKLKDTFVDEIIEILKTNKMRKGYYCLPVFDKDKGEKYKISAIYEGTSNEYIECEIIYLAVSFLRNLGDEDITILIDNMNKKKCIVDNLEAVEIPVGNKDCTKYENLDFDVCLCGKVVGHGKTDMNKNITYFEIDVERLLDCRTFNLDLKRIDAIVRPVDEEAKSDAFIIASNLRSNGFIVEIDYDGTIESKNSEYLVSIDKDSLERYEVSLKDLKTDEEKVINIDKLIEEISFM